MAIPTINQARGVSSRTGKDVDAAKAKLEGEAFFAGRLSSPLSALVLAHNEMPRVQWEHQNLEHVLRTDYAHIIMLVEQSLMEREHASALVQALDEVKRAGPDKFVISPGYGSIVLQMEKVLASRVGEDIAGRLSTARSRLDHGATIRRLSERAKLLELLGDVLRLQETLLAAALKYKDVVSLTYTHMQQAQPATFGHYLLAYHERLADCYEQLTQVYKRVDRSPLGTVGLSGTDLNIDRERTAQLLGFSCVMENSRCGRDSYYQIEMVGVLATILTVLNDFCTDLHIFGSIEFGTVEMHDSHCSTSSIFPQKKNPYALETVKEMAGQAAGWISMAYAAFRNEGTGDSAARNLSQLGDWCNKTGAMAMITREVVQKMTVHEEKLGEWLDRSWVTTNRLGNVLLVKYGLNYRLAHGIVARLVRNCMATGVRKEDVTLAMLEQAAAEMGSLQRLTMGEEELRQSLDHREFLKSNCSAGGVGNAEFVRMWQQSKQAHEREATRLKGRKTKLDRAEAALDQAARALRH